MAVLQYCLFNLANTRRLGKATIGKSEFHSSKLHLQGVHQPLMHVQVLQFEASPSCTNIHLCVYVHKIFTHFGSISSFFVIIIVSWVHLSIARKKRIINPLLRIMRTVQNSLVQIAGIYYKCMRDCFSERELMAGH